MNHVLDGDDRCTVCLVQWRGLTDRDRQVLATAGKCLGRPQAWVSCRRHYGQLCLGEAHQECRG